LGCILIGVELVKDLNVTVQGILFVRVSCQGLDE